MEDRSRKEAALSALRIWRTYMDSRDPLVLAARSAECSIADIVTASGLAKGTVRSILDSQEDTSMTSPVDHLAPYHHPHLVSVAPGRWEGDKTYTFRLFTGSEAKPASDWDRWRADGLSPDDCLALSSEYEAAGRMWGQAAFKLAARPALVKAEPTWREYQQARAELESVFASFWETADGRWRAQLLRLTDAQQAAVRAANRWDEVSESLAELEYEHGREVGDDYSLTLSRVAPEFGLDVKDWEIYHFTEYQGAFSYGGRPGLRKLGEEIEGQNKRLREIADLAGER